MKDRCLAIIPARGGSKRVPKKNLRALAGRPLIAYTIDAALQSGVFERVVVSTDSPEIAAVAHAAGAEVPFLRDAALADDITPVSAVSADVLARIDPTSQFARVCQLMANCPLRDADDVIRSHRQFSAGEAPSQISVVRYGWQNPWWAMRRKEDFVLAPIFPEAQSVRSQDLPELYCPTGAIWWARAETLRSHLTFHVPERTGWEIHWKHGIDIDTEEDWSMTELLFEIACGPTSR